MRADCVAAAQETGFRRLSAAALQFFADCSGRRSGLMLGYAEATRPTCGGQVIPQSVLHPGSAGDAPLRVALLGGFGVAVGDEPLGQFGTPRLQSLVAYPLMHRAAPHLRQHLAFLLWPDSSEAQARTNLRNLLHRLTTALPEARRFLDAGSVAIRLRPGAPLSVDVAEFETNFARAAELEHSGEQDRSLEALEAAVSLYRGE